MDWHQEEWIPAKAHAKLHHDAAAAELEARSRQANYVADKILIKRGEHLERLYDQPMNLKRAQEELITAKAHAELQHDAAAAELEVRSRQANYTADKILVSPQQERLYDEPLNDQVLVELALLNASSNVLVTR